MTNQETTTETNATTEEEVEFYRGYSLLCHDDGSWHVVTQSGAYIPRFANFSSYDELAYAIDESLDNVDIND